MKHYVGLDVSLKLTAICIVDRTGKIEREGVVTSDPDTIAAFVKSHAPHVARIGLEAGATSTWLWTRMGLKEALAQVGAKVGDGSEYYRMDGAVVGPILTTHSSGWNGVYGMHRADLSRVLAEALPGTTIRTAHRCVGFEQNAHVAQLKFANGMSAEADVVIGADGIQSVLQKTSSNRPYQNIPAPVLIEV